MPHGSSSEIRGALMSDHLLTYDALKELAKDLDRPLYTLEVTQQDPFTVEAPARLARAEWFADLWQRFKFQPGAHLRRIHYVLISQPENTVLMPDGSPYLNLARPCFDLLNKASLDARYLNLVRPEWLVDRRNDDPVIYLPNDASDAELNIAGGLLENELHGFEVPQLELTQPTIWQRFHVEIWCEKTTMNDILLPLRERYGVNLITGSGEQSLTSCVNVVKRALASGRPVRILYISDFDPAGTSMPVAAARKIEFRLYQEQLSGVLDIQVRPIMLTNDQCIEYRLPRTPIKDTEKRAEKFEERFGEGATELDALEALHPGEFERILTQEINRYYDDELDDRISDVAGEVQSDLDEVNDEVHREHAEAIKELKAEHKKALAAIKAFEKKAKPILRRIEDDLSDQAPDLNAYDWPDPDDFEGDEDDDPLFDSTREFVEQVDRFKEHQGKPITGKAYDKVCPQCGETFAAKISHARFCSKKCSSAFDYEQRKVKYDKVCKECGTDFTAGHADAQFCSKKCGNRFGMRQARLKAKN
jgi:hypothetical protein